MSSLLAKIILLSLSGTVLAMLIVLCKSLIRKIAPRSFLYYVWLFVLLRLIIPTATPINFTGSVIANEPLGAMESILSHGRIDMGTLPNDGSNISKIEAHGIANDWNEVRPEDYVVDQSRVHFMKASIPFIWLIGAVLFLLYTWIAYWRFSRLIIKTSTMPSEENQSVFASLSSDHRLGFISSKYIKTPMHIGVLQPYIVVPMTDYVGKGKRLELEHILLHEIMHYRKKDLLYKWFVLFVNALHWFNPFMFLVRREISKACELACDEAVVKDMTAIERMQYGETLINLSIGSKIPAGIVATTLIRQKHTMKERIINIKKYSRPKKWAYVVTIVLTVSLAGCAATLGLPPTKSEPPVNHTEPPSVNSQQHNSDLQTTLPSDHTSTSLPFVTLPSALPLSLPQREGEPEKLPLGTNRLLPLWELPKDTSLDFPVLYAWQYRTEPLEFNSLVTAAENAANQIWGSMTKENPDEHHITFWSETINTEYGPYRERISVKYNYTLQEVDLDFHAGWTLYEATAFHYGEQVELDTAELISVAHQFAQNMGLGQYASGTPIIEGNTPPEERGMVDDDVVSAQQARIRWPYLNDGLPGAGGLSLEIINGRVATLFFKIYPLTRMDVQEPSFILNAQEALYCINYAHSHIAKEYIFDSVFASRPILLSVSPVLTNAFHPEENIFIPAWEFVTATDNAEPQFSGVIYVNASTGEVHTASKEGRYPSPYDP